MIFLSLITLIKEVWCINQYINKVEKWLHFEEFWEVSVAVVKNLLPWQQVPLRCQKTTSLTVHAVCYLSVSQKLTILEFLPKVWILYEVTTKVLKRYLYSTTGTFLWRKKCSTCQSCIFPKWLLTKSIL